MESEKKKVLFKNVKVKICDFCKKNKCMYTLYMCIMDQRVLFVFIYIFGTFSMKITADSMYKQIVNLPIFSKGSKWFQNGILHLVIWVKNGINLTY
jgi:hypothetical protein